MARLIADIKHRRITCPDTLVHAHTYAAGVQGVTVYLEVFVDSAECVLCVAFQHNEKNVYSIFMRFGSLQNSMKKTTTVITTAAAAL